MAKYHGTQSQDVNSYVNFLSHFLLCSANTGWKDGVIDFFGSKTRGMAGLLLSFEYSVGYLSVASAKEASIPGALIMNSHDHVRFLSLIDNYKSSHEKP